MNCIYVRFDKALDYKSVVNSFYVKKFLEGVFGEFPTMVTPTKFTFDRDKLGEWVQDQYDKSEDYFIDSKPLPINIAIDYLHAHKVSGNNLQLLEFEPEFGLLDDHLVVIDDGLKVIGVFVAEDDFGKIINEF